MDPDQLIAGWLDDSLLADERATLDDWLKSEDEQLRRFTDAVMFDQQIQSAIVAVEEKSAAASFNLVSETPRSEG